VTPQAIHLGLPLAWPAPPPDCEVCQALARQRTRAAADGDHSRVSDCNVEIRNHHTA
jgi:hypothetical protein